MAIATLVGLGSYAWMEPDSIATLVGLGSYAWREPDRIVPHVIILSTLAYFFISMWWLPNYLGFAWKMILASIFLLIISLPLILIFEIYSRLPF
jgi:hypothetical protein